MTWIFGYGSLVSPVSLESTIRRPVSLGSGMFIAELTGYQRAWNYGSAVQRGDWTRDDGSSISGGLVVSLGLVADADESINGVVFSVNDDELAELDWRERAYDRVDVTDRVTLIPPTADGELDDTVAVYVPRRVAIERYEEHRDAGTAGVRKSYWDLVDDAFGELGPDHLDWYRRTPPPDVPVVDIRLDRLPSRRPRSR
ncbi:gamma-glutamylcyclotransferase family protein [Ilumatobacter nonamiensis]|uniref:gamma-glutamylcyclotransferase family protein n=1 Tax=Ilumatobacter nonamiensis TaxID=467093 RepID=UPI000344AA76|nr:gamma-glutamylcyclotransferase family protein [Ilumatobacter nonamiensis]